MAGTIQINTETVRAAANTISSANMKIEKEFDIVKSAVKRLNSTWDGEASNKANANFNKLKSEFCGSSGRRVVMDNYVKFLHNAVALDYESTENINNHLSELFK